MNIAQFALQASIIQVIINNVFPKKDIISPGVFVYVCRGDLLSPAPRVANLEKRRKNAADSM